MKKTKSSTATHFLLNTAIILLALFSVYRLTVLSFSSWLDRQEDNLNSRVDRLYYSIVNARRQTDSLSDSFNRWYIQRMYAIAEMCENESEDYSDFVKLGRKYIDGSHLYLYDIPSRRLLDTNSSPIPTEIIDSVFADTGSATGYVDSQQYRYIFIRIDERLFIMRTDMEEFRDFLDNIYTAEEIIRLNLKDGDNFFFVTENDTMRYFHDNSLEGKPVSEVLSIEYDFSSNVLGIDTSFVLQYVNKSLMFTVKREIADTDMYLHYGVPVSSYLKEWVAVILPVGIIFFVVLLLYSRYLYYLRTDLHNHRLRGGNKVSTVVYKALSFAAMGIAAAVGIAYYLKTIYSLSYLICNYKKAFTDVNYVINDTELCLHDLQADFDKQALADARIVSSYLSDHPERRTPADLKRFSDALSLEYIMLFDIEGRQTVTDSSYVGYSISTDPENPSYIFNPLKHGISHVIAPLQKDDLTKSDHQIVGVTTKDQNGQVDGFLQTVYYPSALLSAQESSSLVNEFDNSIISNVFDCYLIDTDTDKILYTWIHDYIGKPAGEIGITKDAMSPDFSGYIEMANMPYFAVSTIINNRCVIVGIPTWDLFSGRTDFTLHTLLLIIIMTIITTIIELLTKVPQITPESQPSAANPYVVVKDNSAMTLSLGARLRALKKRWPYMLAEERIGKRMSVILMIAVTVINLGLLFRKQLFGENTVIDYIYGETWPKGINIFSVTAALNLIIGAVFIIAVIREVLDLLAKILSPRAETICHLIRSFLEYGIAILVVFRALGYFGVDVRTISATVGFLSLIIGFGAKSLITDIVAGIFIIFEREFQVGDIVEIGGYRGMVKEIGLRTTKIVSWDKNVKIINNSNVSNVVNMTMHNSFATVNFSIPFSEAIDDVEKIFAEELPKLKEKYPSILGGPFFTGILSFSGGRMACRISAEVKELERGELETILHREVQEIMQRHNIPLS